MNKRENDIKSEKIKKKRKNSHGLPLFLKSPGDIFSDFLKTC